MIHFAEESLPTSWNIKTHTGMIHVNNKVFAIADIDYITKAVVEDHMGSGGIFISSSVVLRSGSTVYFMYDGDYDIYDYDKRVIIESVRDENIQRMNTLLVDPIINIWAIFKQSYIVNPE